MNIIEGPTIPQLARKMGMNKRTLFRRLMVLHGRDRAEPGFVPWLYRYRDDGTWRVNMARLRRAHPELFGVATNEELDTRLRRAEHHIEKLDAGHRTLVRRVNAKLGALES